MKVYLIKLITGEIRTYHKGYKGPFSYFKNDYNKLLKFYSDRKDKYLIDFKKSKIAVYMADEQQPLHLID